MCTPHTVDRGHSRRPSAFSLVELIMVIVIISIIAAVAVPRVSNAGKDAQVNAVRATVAAVNRAIDQFYAEHSRYPGFNPANDNPNGDWFVNQLTKYSDFDGNVQDAPGGKFLFGPYLQAPFPVNPYNGLATVTVKPDASTSVKPNGCGWVATLADGSFGINLDVDDLPLTSFTATERIAIETLVRGE